MEIKKIIEKKVNYVDSRSDDTTLIVVSVLAFFLIMLIGIIVFGFLIKIIVSDGTVAIEGRETTPLAFNLLALFIIIIIAIYVAARISREES